MKHEQVEEIIDCLPKGRTLFPYFRDRYAAMLLAWVFKGECSIAEIKQSRFSGLLKKELLKESIASCGNGKLDDHALSMVWSNHSEQFLLTLGTWGGGNWRWQQTTRPGHNLVLQVNLHDGYRRRFEDTVPSDDQWRFSSVGHPVMEKGERNFYRTTLGWVRIDLDFETDEVLIEELQTDWLRDMRTLLRWYEHAGAGDKEATTLILYCQTMLKRLESLWAEALLAAALWFAREELGLYTVWYHTFDSGCRLKQIRGCRPPRSLYTSLPKRFCFEHTTDQPEFLLHDKKLRRTMRKQPEPQWFRLNLQ